MAENRDIMSEAYLKRFQQICEFTIPSATLDEEGEDQNQQQDAQMPPMDGGEAPAEMPADPNMGGGMPPQGGDPNAAADGAMPQGGDMGADPNAAGGAQGGVEGFNPQVDQNMGDGAAPMPADEGQMQPDDEVIDVTELTDKQDEVMDSVEDMDEKFGKIIKYLGSVEQMIDTQNKKLEDIKVEFEKRNPTQIEKLGLQTTHSYPFSMTVDDYWKNKEKTSNYSTEPDNNGKDMGQYVITKDDVNGNVNWKEIANSMDDEDEIIYNQTLRNMIGL